MVATRRRSRVGTPIIKQLEVQQGLQQFGNLAETLVASSDDDGFPVCESIVPSP